MLPREGTHVEVAAGWLRTENGKIAEIHRGTYPGIPDFGTSDGIIAPGFVDIHVHLPQFRVLGTDGDTLLDWLTNTVFPAEIRWENPEHALKEAKFAIHQMLSAGTTSFAGYLTAHHESAWAVMEEVEKLGISAALGLVLQDQNSPPQLQKNPQAMIKETEKLISRYPRGNSVEAAITPRFAPTCSMELLKNCGELAKSTGSMIQTHLAENQRECLWVEELFGNDYVSVYADAGILSPFSLFGPRSVANRFPITSRSSFRQHPRPLPHLQCFFRKRHHELAAPEQRRFEIGSRNRCCRRF